MSNLKIPGSTKPGGGKIGYGDHNQKIRASYKRKLDLNRSKFLDIVKIDAEDNRKIDVFGNRPRWKAIVLRVDSPAGADPANTSFFNSLVSTVKQIQEYLGTPPELVKVKARIDLLHAGLLEPDQPGNVDGPHQRQVERHPTFVAQTEQTRKPEVGEEIWVTFERPEEYKGGIYLGPVKHMTSNAPPAGSGAGSAGGAGNAFGRGNCKPPGLLGSAATGDAIDASQTPPAPPPYIDKALEEKGGIIGTLGDIVPEADPAADPAVDTAALEAELASVRARKEQLIAARGEDFPTGLEDQKILRIEAQLAGIEGAASMTTEHGQRLGAEQARAADANPPVQSPANLTPTSTGGASQACSSGVGSPVEGGPPKKSTTNDAFGGDTSRANFDFMGMLDENTSKRKSFEYIILHDGGGWGNASDPGAVKSVIKTTWLPRNVSSHYYIGDNGTIYQLTSERLACHSAGCGRKHSKNRLKCPVPNANVRGIAIDLRHDRSKLNNKSPLRRYSDAQIESLNNLLQDISRRRNIPLDDQHVLAHFEIVKSHHSDPHPDFKWSQVTGITYDHRVENGPRQQPPLVSG